MRGATGLFAAAAGYLGWRAWRRGKKNDLHGKVAIVTGGSKGLGLAIARELAHEGCQIGTRCTNPVLAPCTPVP